MSTTATQPTAQDTAPTKTPQRAEIHFVSPRADVTETKGAYLLHLDLPGVSKSALEVVIDKGKLTVTGHRDFPEGEPVYSERRTVGFRRCFEIGQGIDGERIEARLEQGVLLLTLPKTEAVKPRTVEVLAS